MEKTSIGKLNLTLFISLIITVICYLLLQTFYIPYVKDMIRDWPGVITPFAYFTMSCNYYFLRTFFLSLIATPVLLIGLYKLIKKHSAKRWIPGLLGGLIAIELITVIVLIAGTEHSKQREMPEPKILRIEGE